VYIGPDGPKALSNGLLLSSRYLYKTEFAHFVARNGIFVPLYSPILTHEQRDSYYCGYEVVDNCAMVCGEYSASNTCDEWGAMVATNCMASCLDGYEPTSGKQTKYSDRATVCNAQRLFVEAGCGSGGDLINHITSTREAAEEAAKLPACSDDCLVELNGCDAFIAAAGQCLSDCSEQNVTVIVTKLYMQSMIDDECLARLEEMSKSDDDDDEPDCTDSCQAPPADCAEMEAMVIGGCASSCTETEFVGIGDTMMEMGTIDQDCVDTILEMMNGSSSTSTSSSSSSSSSMSSPAAALAVAAAVAAML